MPKFARVIAVILISLICSFQHAEAHLTSDGYYTRPGTDIRVFLNIREIPLTPAQLERLDYDLDLLPSKNFKGLVQIRTVGINPRSQYAEVHAISANIVTMTVLTDPVEELAQLDYDLPAAIGAHAFFNMSPAIQKDWSDLYGLSLDHLDLADHFGIAFSHWATGQLFNEIKFLTNPTQPLPGPELIGLDQLLFAGALFVRHGNKIAMFTTDSKDPKVQPDRKYVKISRTDDSLTIDNIVLRVNGDRVTGTLDRDGNLIVFNRPVSFPQILQDAVPIASNAGHLSDRTASTQSSTIGSQATEPSSFDTGSPSYIPGPTQYIPLDLKRANEDLAAARAIRNHTRPTAIGTPHGIIPSK